MKITDFQNEHPRPWHHRRAISPQCEHTLSGGGDTQQSWRNQRGRRRRKRRAKDDKVGCWEVARGTVKHRLFILYIYIISMAICSDCSVVCDVVYSLFNYYYIHIYIYNNVILFLVIIIYYCIYIIIITIKRRIYHITYIYIYIIIYV